jgi:hypothetical protein
MDQRRWAVAAGTRALIDAQNIETISFRPLRDLQRRQS